MALEINAQFNKFLWKEKIFFDLSGEDAVITETHFGQDLTANIAPRANDA